jgi:hypothetical protein
LSSESVLELALAGDEELLATVAVVWRCEVECSITTIKRTPAAKASSAVNTVRMRKLET